MTNDVPPEVSPELAAPEADSPGVPGLSAYPRQRDTPRPHSANAVVRYLEHVSRPVILLQGFLLVAAVGALDYVTGFELAFSIFYLLPVAMVAWASRSRDGAVLAVVAAAVWFAADTAAGHSYSAAWMPFWNAAVRLGVFLALALVVSGLRRLWISERNLARTDHLTGVQNGRAFYDLLELEMSRALRYERPFTLAYLDVDEFKRVNDEHGHTEGDRVLQLIADTIRANIRSMDAIARLGGDEFALLLPETGPGAAEIALRKIQHRLMEVARDDAPGISFSIGAVICVGPPDTADRLIQMADSLMYAVKREGKNGLRIEVLDENYGIEAILQRS